MAVEPFIQLPGGGRTVQMGAFQMRVRAEADQTGGSFTVLEADEPPGFRTTLHVHDDCAEAFYVLAGEYVIVVADAEHVCPAGSFIYIPAGCAHGFRVGGSRSRKLNVYVPAAMVGYFEDLAAAQAAGTVLDADGMTRAAARHAMRVLGPLPEFDR